MLAKGRYTQLKILKIAKRLTLFLAAYIAYAVVLNLSVFDAKPSELAMSYQQGEALSAKHYRLSGLPFLDRDAEEVGREIFGRERVELIGYERPEYNDVLELLSTGEVGKSISSYLDFSELVGIAAIAENDVVFESADWRELNRRLTNIDWQGLGTATLDAESHTLFYSYGIYYEYLEYRLWQLVYIIRNEDEIALAEWLGQYMKYIEYTDTDFRLSMLGLSPLYSSETMRELLDLEFLSTAGRSNLTEQLKDFIERIDRNRSAIFVRVKEDEARLVVGTLILASRYASVAGVWGNKLKSSGWAESTLNLAAVVFFQRQRFINRAADYSDKRLAGVMVTPRPIYSKILFPQDIAGELILDNLWQVDSRYYFAQSDESDQRWNAYVDSLVEFRAELAQKQ